MKKLHCITLLLLLMIAACKKEERKPVGNYTFTSEISGPVNVDIYASMDDYNNNKGIVYHGVVPASGKLNVPMNIFKENTEYFVDWYTDNYKFSNWFGGGKTTIGIPSSDGGYVIEQGSIGNRRVFMQNGKEPKVRWVAVGIYNDPGKWNQLTPAERKYEVSFTKDYKQTFQFPAEDYAGIVSDVFGDGDELSIILGDPRNTGHFWIMFNGLDDSSGFDARFSPDTMVLLSDDNAASPFLMKRQK